MTGKFPLITMQQQECFAASACTNMHGNSINGAKSSAIIYSITETAKANNLNLFRYLDYVLRF